MDCTFLPALSTWESRRMQPTEHSSIALIMRLTRRRLLRKPSPEAKFPVFSHNGTSADPSSIHRRIFFPLFFRKEQKRSRNPKWSQVRICSHTLENLLDIPPIITRPSWLPEITGVFPVITATLLSARAFLAARQKTNPSLNGVCVKLNCGWHPSTTDVPFAPIKTVAR